MYSKKKLLVETVFETAKKELPRASINSLSNYLSSLFDERYDFSRDERSFTRYYKSLIQDGEDYNIDDITLLYLSKYIGYKDFEDFCSKINIEGGDGSTTFKLGFSDILSEQTPQVSITVNPTFKMPEFMKKNGMGFMEIALLVSLTTGSIAFSKKPNTQARGLGGILQPQCMYWDKSEYKPADCDDKNPVYSERVPFDYEKFTYFKRIERKDTLTAENAFGKVWYSKYNGEVEFFTDDGTDPNNGRELRKATEYIIEKYGGVAEEE